jgi:aarF domain-containing kinase
MAARRVLRRAGFAVTGTAVGGGIGATVFAAKDESFGRGLKFWSMVTPAVVQYFYTHYTVTDEALRDEAFAALHEKYAPLAKTVVLELRGLYVKFGQLAASRAELVPRAYRDAFSDCMDKVPPFPEADVRAILDNELPGGLDGNFAAFDFVPCGAASIGQAHRARLHDGREVVVKVQYPNVGALFDVDFRNMCTLASLADADLAKLVRKVETQFREELDYAQEMQNCRYLHDRVTGVFPNVAVPMPLEPLSTPHVITMDYLPGPRLDLALKDLNVAPVEPGAVVAQIESARSSGASSSPPERASVWEGSGPQAGSVVPAEVSWKLRVFARVAQVVGLEWFWRTLRLVDWLRGRVSLDAHRILRDLLEVHGFEVFSCDLFNGDPHAGNILLLPDGRLGLIDYGQCRRLTPETRNGLARLIIAISDDDAVAIHDCFTKLGLRTQNNDVYFTAHLAKLIFGKLEAKFFDRQFHVDLHARDKVERFPPELFFVYRCSSLIRSLAFSLRHDVSVAEHWRPFAQACLQ